MPKVIIAEKDLTSAEAVQYDDYIVLIPGLTPLAGTIGKEEVIVDASGAEGTVNEMYFTDADTFESLLPDAESGEVEKEWDVSTKMTYRLLQLGMTVLYRVISSWDVLKDTGDTKFWKQYKDKGLYNLRFLTCGGHADIDATNAMIQCAAERGDAIAVVDFPEAGTRYVNLDDEDVEFNYDAQSIKDYVDCFSVETIERENGVEENPFKYATAFAPNITFKESRLLGTTSYPASFAYLACFAKHTKNFKDWFAMAGSVRGKLPYEQVKTDYRYGQEDIDILQDRITEGSKAVNVVAEIRPYGNIVWGNRTLYPITRDPETDTIGLKASSFLNIRHLCCDIKKTLFRAARRFTFEPNSDTLWINFKGAITPLLEEMRAGQGIKGYKIIKETTTQKATLKAVVKIIPIEAVEDFDLTVELSDSISVTE